MEVFLRLQFVNDEDQIAKLLLIVAPLLLCTAGAVLCARFSFSSV